MTRPQDVALSIRSVSKSFGGIKVAHDISFDVGVGERLAVIGPNGAGKTTLFNLLTGVFPVDSGEVILFGHDITRLPSHERISRGLARSFQNIRLVGHLTVQENVLLAEHHRLDLLNRLLGPLPRMKSLTTRDATRDALDEIGLGAYWGRLAGTLPYGVQKLVEFARAVSAQPRVLLLDEPAAGLNGEETSRFGQLLDRVVPESTSVVLVEHDMHFVQNFSQHVVVLNFGQKIAEGPLSAVRSNDAVIEAYLGTDDEAVGHAA